MAKDLQIKITLLFFSNILIREGLGASLARIRSECTSFIEDILATSKGTPQFIGKFFN